MDAILDIYLLENLGLKVLNKIGEILESNRIPAEIQNMTVLVDFTPPTRQVDSFLSLGILSDGRFRSV